MAVERPMGICEKSSYSDEEHSYLIEFASALGRAVRVSASEVWATGADFLDHSTAIMEADVDVDAPELIFGQNVTALAFKKYLPELDEVDVSHLYAGSEEIS